MADLPPADGQTLRARLKYLSRRTFVMDLLRGRGLWR